MSDTIDTTSEKALLGIVLADPPSRHEAARLVGEDHFADRGHLCIWRHLEALGDAATPNTLISALGASGELEAAGGPSGIIDIWSDATGAEHIGFYAGNLSKALSRRRGLKLADILGKAMSNPLSDPDEVLADCTSKLVSATTGRGCERRGIPDVMHEVTEEMEAQISGEGGGGIATRWDCLNYRCPIKPGSYAIVSAATSGGKSVFATNIAADVVRAGGAAAFFSYEMPATDIMRRMLADHTGIAPAKIFTPRANPMTRDESSRFVAAQSEISGWGLHLYDNPTLGTSKIGSICRGLRAEGNLDLVVVDYIQLVPPEGGDNRELQVASISRSLRGLSLELGVPVVALSQLNEDGKTRESRAIIQDAEILLNIEPDDDQIYVVKQRNGPKNFPLHIVQRPGTLSFVEHGGNPTVSIP